jgi:hypothetical protein
MATEDIFSGDEAEARLKQLPPDVRNLIYSADMTNIIRAIGDTYQLHIDQIGRLESETSFLMLGFTEQKDFVRVLSERIPTDADTARRIASDVHDKLLIKIRESLHKLYPESLDPVTGERPGAPTLHERPAIHSAMPIPVAEKLAKPVTSPAPTPKQNVPLATIDAALNATQATPAQTVSVGGLPSKQQVRDYANDPYLEPIE